jgi:hypothetical protein
MPGDVSFWPEARNDWEAVMAGSRAGRAKERGPSGPEVHSSEVYAADDLFVTAPASLGGTVLFRKGALIPAAYVGLPQVPAVWQNGVLVPGS